MRLLGIVVLAVLAACSGGVQRTAENLASSAPAPLRDAAAAGAIVTKLAAIDVDSTTSVHVGVHGGLVTLTGQVRSQELRKKFEGAARGVVGVRSVDDRTTVNPKVRSVRESVSDAALLAKVNAVLLAQTGVNAVKLKTSVRDGVVTLTGAVPTAAIRTTMLDSVRTLGGVRTLIDHISVRP